MDVSLLRNHVCKPNCADLELAANISKKKIILQCLLKYIISKISNVFKWDINIIHVIKKPISPTLFTNIIYILILL